MNLKIRIEQEMGKENYNVILTVKFQAFEDIIKKEIKSALIEVLKDIFEIETISTLEVIEQDEATTKLKIKTHDAEKVKRLNKKMTELFKQDKSKSKIDVPTFELQKFNLN